mmetsp:Transcript_6113/g.15134  ORF Transcript_6113/g.15134 Transcript_6113/m.15134 type:complete len:98 (-) Transcript_6113:437-730(-)
MQNATRFVGLFQYSHGLWLLSQRFSCNQCPPSYSNSLIQKKIMDSRLTDSKMMISFFIEEAQRTRKKNAGQSLNLYAKITNFRFYVWVSDKRAWTEP